MGRNIILKNSLMIENAKVLVFLRITCSCKTGTPHWEKAENWLIAKEMTKEELLSTDLGQFLNKI